MKKKIREWIKDADLNDFALFIISIAFLLACTLMTFSAIVRIFLMQ